MKKIFIHKTSYAIAESKMGLLRVVQSDAAVLVAGAFLVAQSAALRRGLDFLG